MEGAIFGSLFNLSYSKKKDFTCYIRLKKKIFLNWKYVHMPKSIYNNWKYHYGKKKRSY